MALRKDATSMRKSLTYPGLAGNEDREKRIETTVMGYIESSKRLHSSLNPKPIVGYSKNPFLHS